MTLPYFLSHPPPPAHISVSRETIRSKKKSDYNLNKTNAPILTNTTLNVIRLVGESCTHIHTLQLTSPWEQPTVGVLFSLLRFPFIHQWSQQRSAHSGVCCYLCDWAALIVVSLCPELWPFVSKEVLTRPCDVALKTSGPFLGKAWPSWCDFHAWKGIKRGSYLSCVVVYNLLLYEFI